MRLENSSYEVEREAEKLLESFARHNKKVFVFGAGQVGERLEIALSHYNIFAGYIDNNPKKIAKGINNQKVYSLEDYMTSDEQGWIVIAAAQNNIQDIVDQLLEMRYKDYEDFFIYSDFEGRVLPLLALYLYNQVFMATVQVCVTERCSLKCRKCAHACYAVSNKMEDMELRTVFWSADSLFSRVDYVREFVLIGGEPLLYAGLAEAIRYIGSKYKNKIGLLCITTNGTILPNREILDACMEYGVRFEVSNYSAQIPRLEIQYRKLTELLTENKITYQLSKSEKQWTDYGFEYVNRKASPDELIEVFDRCHTPCREIRGNRLYFCVMARSVSENLNYNIGAEDYLDLDIQGGGYKESLLKFNLGYSEKGYLDMCNFCHGAERVNYPIPVAEQITCEIIHQKLGDVEEYESNSALPSPVSSDFGK